MQPGSGQYSQAQWKINMEAFQQALVQAPRLLVPQVTFSTTPQRVDIKLIKTP